MPPGQISRPGWTDYVKEMNKKGFLFAALALLPCMMMKAQSMENVLAPRRQGLAVIAALEAKGDQAGLETALAAALDGGLTISEAKEALSQLLSLIHI